MIEHGFQALAADVTIGVAVNGVADRHVVGGNGFGDGAGRAADAEEPARHLLSRADLGEGAVLAGIQVDLERLLMRAENFSCFVVSHSGGDGNTTVTGEKHQNYPSEREDASFARGCHRFRFLCHLLSFKFVWLW